MRKDADLAVSNSGKMVVVGTRKQNLYAASELIDAGNQALTSAKARVRLSKGPEGQEKDRRGLFKVIPVVVNGTNLSKGVSDSVIHPVLKQLVPLSTDDEHRIRTKSKKYRGFWKVLEDHVLELSIGLSKWENRKYTRRLYGEIPRPRPGFTPTELRDMVAAQADEIARTISNEYVRKFFHTLVTRRLIEEYDGFVARMKDEVVSGEEIDREVLAARKREKEEQEKDDFGWEEPEEYFMDLIAFAPSELERAKAKQAAYERSFEESDGAWEQSYKAALFMQDKLTILKEQIGDEIDSSPTVLIAPKRCSDMTRFIYAAENLNSIPENKAGGRFHYSETTVQYGTVFHSAGIVMQEGTDMITLECADGSGALPVGRNTWWFHMYGAEPGMSFAAQTKARWSTIV